MLNLHNQIEEDWTLLRSKLETEILQKHAHDNQFYILLLFCKKHVFLYVNRKRKRIIIYSKMECKKKHLSLLLKFLSSTTQTCYIHNTFILHVH